jgi:hypothetical protein
MQNSGVLVPHGRILLLDEVLAQSLALRGCSVRTLGQCALPACQPSASTNNPHSVTAYDAASAVASLSHKGCQLRVDVSLAPLTAYRVGSLMQVIGEVELRRRSGDAADAESVVLLARIARCVDGLDLELYEQALRVRREFESSLA